MSKESRIRTLKGLVVSLEDKINNLQHMLGSQEFHDAVEKADDEDLGILIHYISDLDLLSIETWIYKQCKENG